MTGTPWTILAILPDGVRADATATPFGDMLVTKARELTVRGKTGDALEAGLLAWCQEQPGGAVDDLEVHRQEVAVHFFADPVTA